MTPLGKVEVWGFRQDSLATMLPNTEVPQCIVSIADGHGPSVPGQLMSQSSHLKMLPRVASVAGEILQWLRDGNTAAVEQKVKDIFAEIDEDLLCTDPVTRCRGVAPMRLLGVHAVLQGASHGTL